jgi:glycosidase
MNFCYRVTALFALSFCICACHLLRPPKASLQSVTDTSSLFSEISRPPNEIYEIVHSLCSRELTQDGSSKESVETSSALSQWSHFLGKERALFRKITCEDLLYAATLIVTMHAPDNSKGQGYEIGATQVEEIFQELLATRASGSPSSELKYTHLQNFSRDADQAARRMVVDFFYSVLRAREQLYAAKNSQVYTYLEDETRVPSDWFSEPYYYTYVQYFGGEGTRNVLSDEQLKRIANPDLQMDMQSDFIGDGNFTTLSKMLPYLRKIGIRNLYILPHYESESGDGGYDVLDYRPATRFGGEKAFDEFLRSARDQNIRVASDAVFNHTSYQHTWFREFRNATPGFSNFYLDVSSWQDLGEVNDGSQGARRYGVGATTFDRVMIFPAISREHLFRYRDPNGVQKSAYRHFYPFQVDLNFLEPRVLQQIWTIVGTELAQGQLGKRADAAIHWIKPVGTSGDGARSAQAAIQLFRHFVSLVNRKAMVFPEAVNWVGKAHELFGESFLMGPRLAKLAPHLGATGLYGFQAQATALREMLAVRDDSAWWAHWEHAERFRPPTGSEWVNLLSHHDETMVGLTREQTRRRFVELVQSSGGRTYKSDFSAAARLPSLLADQNKRPDPRRVAMAHAALFALPGVPQIYYGDEVMTQNNETQLRSVFAFQKAYFQRMSASDDVQFQMPKDDNIYDPRELLRGNIPASAFQNAVLSADTIWRPDGLVIRAIRELSRLRSEPEFRDSFHSYTMRRLHTGGDGSVLGLVRIPETAAKPVAFLMNLKGQQQDVWLRESEMKAMLGLTVHSGSELSGRVLLRLVSRQSGPGRAGDSSVPSNSESTVAHAADLAQLLTSGEIGRSQSQIVGALHEGHLRVSLNPYEFIVFAPD